MMCRRGATTAGYGRYAQVLRQAALASVREARTDYPEET
jgi:hypothetical protein